MQEKRIIKEGQIYKHFKGTTHRIICIAKHSETKEDMIIYTHNDDNEIWARPIDMFLSEVDHEKYPNVEQKYRFELLDREGNAK